MYRLYPYLLYLPSNAAPGSTVKVRSSWQNIGRAYCPTNIRQWKGRYALAYALLRPDESVLRVFVDTDADISKIVKGSIQTFDSTIDLSDVPAGKYTWAIAIVNTEKGNVPGIELSVKDADLTAEGWLRLCDVLVK